MLRRGAERLSQQLPRTAPHSHAHSTALQRVTPRRAAPRRGELQRVADAPLRAALRSAARALPNANTSAVVTMPPSLAVSLPFVRPSVRSFVRPSVHPSARQSGLSCRSFAVSDRSDKDARREVRSAADLRRGRPGRSFAFFADRPSAHQSDRPRSLARSSAWPALHPPINLTVRSSPVRTPVCMQPSCRSVGVNEQGSTM